MRRKSTTTINLFTRKSPFVRSSRYAARGGHRQSPSDCRASPTSGNAIMVPIGGRYPLHPLDVLGHPRRQHQDWLDDDEEIRNIAEKNIMQEKHINSRSDTSNAWTNRKADNIRPQHQRNRADAHLRRYNAPKGETDSERLSRALQKCTRPPIYDLRRPQRPGPPAFPSRNNRSPATTLRRKSIGIQGDPG
ncbi:hypothetical protein SprV_0501859700 [Sparganum proliferum]